MSARRLAPSARLLATLCLVSGCAAARGGTEELPVLDAITPDSVQVSAGVVVEVTLTGSGFRYATPGENTVRLGPAILRAVPASADGRRIAVVIPDVIQSDTEAPPAPFESGTYPVQVETSAGKSNVLMLRIVR